MENNYLSDCLNFKIEISDTSGMATLPRDLQIDRLELNKIININHMDYAIETIYYDFNKWFIRPDAAKELDKLVQVMKENPVMVELGSHTDSRGSWEYNLDLSQKRAESAVRYILMQGIDATRITAKGYGESQPVNHCTDGIPCSAREHQANRRTEFKVTGFTKPDANSVYDMNKFKDQEEIPAYLLDQDFFMDCLQDRKLVKSYGKADPETPVTPVETKQAPAVKTPAADKKPVNEPKPVAPAKKPATDLNKPKQEAAPEKARETARPGTSVATSSSSVKYRVQIYALSRQKSLVDPEFEDLQDVQMYVEDGMYKYTTGVFNTHEEAARYRDVMKQVGFSDAFVVTFANNKRIYISPAN
jgi:outer membrane protein OmpA-like peptidoglycan-associated protein